jgi:hypothetical protein
MAHRRVAWHHRPMKLSPAYLWIFVPTAILSANSTIDMTSRGFHWLAAIPAFACIMSSVCIGFVLALALRKSNA